MRFTFAAAAFAALFMATPARAEVASSSPSAFVIEAEAEVATTPDRAWRALGQLGRWWNDEHTYSGDGSRMQVDLRAGGCWCERWGNGQSVQHGRVLLIMEHDRVRTLRFDAPLGPLQELAVNGVLTFTVAPHASGAKITMTYRVLGDASINLDQMALWWTWSFWNNSAASADTVRRVRSINWFRSLRAQARGIKFRTGSGLVGAPGYGGFS